MNQSMASIGNVLLLMAVTGAFYAFARLVTAILFRNLG